MVAAGENSGLDVHFVPPLAGTGGADGDPALARPRSRIDERDLGAFAQSLDHDAALGALLHLYVARLESFADLDEHVVLAVLVEDRLSRHVDGTSGRSLPSSMTVAERARLEPWIETCRTGSVTSKRRVTLEVDSKKLARLASPDNCPIRAVNFSPGSASTSTTADLSVNEVGRSLSSIFARSSIRPDSMTSATGRPGQI